MKPTFHERQYELAMNLELIAGSAQFFAPMQVIEEKVGYDIALVPGHMAIWANLGVKQPTGVQTPVEYGAKSIPVAGGQSFAASLFVQYKRAEKMFYRSALQTGDRAQAGGDVPFFRVYFDKDQHEVLVDLEQAVGQNAVVRYAAPLFHLIEDLWVRQSTRSVFGSSSFIPPASAGIPASVWTYADDGTSIFCSEPRRGEAEDGNGVLQSLVRMSLGRDRPGTNDHLRSLAAEVEQVDLTERRRRQRFDDLGERGASGDAQWTREPLTRSEWEDRLHAVAPEGAQQLEPAVDAAVVANAAASVGFTWLLASVRPTTGT